MKYHNLARYRPLEPAQTIVLLLTFFPIRVIACLCFPCWFIPDHPHAANSNTHIAWIYLRWCLLLSDHGKSPFCTTIWENIIFCFAKHPTSKSKIYSKAEAETFYTKLLSYRLKSTRSNWAMRNKKHGCLGYIGDYTTQFIWGWFHKTMT